MFSIASFAAAIAAVSGVTQDTTGAQPIIIQDFDNIVQSIVTKDESKFEASFADLLHALEETTNAPTYQSQDLPVFWVNIAEGTADGLLNNKSDLLNCIFSMAAVVQDIQQFHSDKGNKTAQISDIKLIFRNDIPSALDICAPVVPEAGAVLSVLQNVTSFHDLGSLLKKNFVADDKSEIFKEIEILGQSIASEDSFTFGTTLGYLLHHLLVGSYSDEHDAPDVHQLGDLPVFWINILEGLADGLLNNRGDLLQCLFGAAGALQDLKAFHEHKGNASAQKDDIMNLIHDVPEAVKVCKLVQPEVKEVLTVLGNVTSFHDLGVLMEHNFKNDHKAAIFKEVEAMVQSVSAEDSFKFGTNLGYLLHHLLIGTYNNEAKIVLV